VFQLFFSSFVFQFGFQFVFQYSCRSIVSIAVCVHAASQFIFNLFFRIRQCIAVAFMFHCTWFSGLNIRVVFQVFVSTVVFQFVVQYSCGSIGFHCSFFRVSLQLFFNLFFRIRQCIAVVFHGSLQMAFRIKH
jgi:hypothetical protein